MKKTLRIVILTESKENLEYDLRMLQEANFVTTDIRDKNLLIKKINYTKALIKEIDEMIREL